MTFLCCALLFCSALSVKLSAQQTSDSLQADTVSAAQPVKKQLEAPLTKSPTSAILYSLLLPGAGQYYVESYWKIPIITGTAATSAYLFFSNNASYTTASDAYNVAVEANPNSAEASRLLRQREAYRDNRDMAGVVFLATYAIAAIDAYVGAHLFDFNVNDDLSFGVQATPGGYLAFQTRIQF